MSRSRLLASITYSSMFFLGFVGPAEAVFIIPTDGLSSFGTSKTFDFENRSPTGRRTGSLTELRFFSDDLQLTITRGGVGFDLVENEPPFQDEKPRNWGDISLDPFAFERDGTPFSLEFSSPVKSLKVSAGDYGADTPDVLKLTAFDREFGTLSFLDDDTDIIPTRPPGSQEFNTGSVSVSDADGIDQAFMIGGTNEFPNSVFYDNISVSRPPLFRLSTDVAKQEELKQLVVKEFNSGVAAYVLVGGGCLAAPAACPFLGTAAKTISVMGNAVVLADLTRIVNDPPRPDYETVFQVRDLNLPPLPDSGGVDPALRELAETAVFATGTTRVLSEAWLVTLERYQGAVAAGDDAAASLQEAALETIIIDLARFADTARKANEALSREYSTAFDAMAINEADVIAARDDFAS